MLDDAFAIRMARIAELEHARPARIAQMRFGSSDDALAQRSAERNAAFIALAVERRTKTASDDALTVALFPVLRSPLVAREPPSGAQAIPDTGQRVLRAVHAAYLDQHFLRRLAQVVAGAHRVAVGASVR